MALVLLAGLPFELDLHVGPSKTLLMSIGSVFYLPLSKLQVHNCQKLSNMGHRRWGRRETG